MEKKSTHKDFIGVYDNYISTKYVDDLIKYFNKVRFDEKKMEVRRAKTNGQSRVEDLRIGQEFVPQKYQDYFNQFVQEKIITEYLIHYPIAFSDLFEGPIQFSGFLLQETQPSQGYHAWHSEWAPLIGLDVMTKDSMQDFCKKYNQPIPPDFTPIVQTVIDRFLVYTMYLNDIEEGGETEFLYQSQRVKPKKGRIVIFPAASTHIHRGNPPLKGNKLILTGWIRSCPTFYN